MVSGIGVHHWDDGAQLFQFPAVAADLPHKVDPGFFKIANVVGVVDDTHLIGFIVVGTAVVGNDLHGKTFFQEFQRPTMTLEFCPPKPNALDMA